MKSTIRIIGGNWRGRKIEVADAEGLRPTPDRIRETLFNWLGFHCRGARVLDCFAGSGVLGIEAMSRGAASLIAIEKQADAAKKLGAQIDRLNIPSAEILNDDALRAVHRFEQAFDLIFIDPPYAKPELRSQIFSLLEQGGLLKEGALLYFEWPKGETYKLPSAKLSWQKQKQAGQANYAVAEWRFTG
ncbi:MAG: 16S rRNA (guanine(966)-N(2))-methyltransferase RsmD [Pseudomonadota bacterium]